MVRHNFLIYILLIPLVISSCRPTRQAVPQSAGEPNAAAYIEKYRDVAISEMRRTGVPASITLAQGMIESNFGRSTLAREANNHFGIKCHSDWKGPAIRHHDDRGNECFRKYTRAEDSFYDHSDFLRSGSRYSFLFDLDATDYKGWARGLKKAGYATNPDYANMLIRKIEEMSLNYYDMGYTEERKKEGVENEILPAAEKRIMENNRIQYIIVMDGETREIIEKEFDLLGWELARYNDLGENFIPVAGQMLYLQPKRDKAEPGKETHTVAEGETMYSISQIYGIRKNRLYEMNRIQQGEEPSPGSKLWLRTMKPVN